MPKRPLTDWERSPQAQEVAAHLHRVFAGPIPDSAWVAVVRAAQSWYEDTGEVKGPAGLATLLRAFEQHQARRYAEAPLPH